MSIISTIKLIRVVSYSKLQKKKKVARSYVFKRIWCRVTRRKGWELEFSVLPIPPNDFSFLTYSVHHRQIKNSHWNYHSYSEGTQNTYFSMKTEFPKFITFCNLLQRILILFLFCRMWWSVVRLLTKERRCLKGEYQDLRSVPCQK